MRRHLNLNCEHLRPGSWGFQVNVENQTGTVLSFSQLFFQYRAATETTLHRVERGRLQTFQPRLSLGSISWFLLQGGTNNLGCKAIRWLVSMPAGLNFQKDAGRILTADIASFLVQPLHDVSSIWDSPYVQPSHAGQASQLRTPEAG